MDASDRLREENIGTAEMIRERAAHMESLASACDAEAREQTASAARLRKRAERLRDQALEYRAAVHALETSSTDVIRTTGLRAPTITVGGDTPPEDPQGGDTWFERDPVDPTTYRRLEYDPTLRNGPNPPGGWVRKAEVTA